MRFFFLLLVVNEHLSLHSVEGIPFFPSKTLVKWKLLTKTKRFSVSVWRTNITIRTHGVKMELNENKQKRWLCSCPPKWLEKKSFRNFVLFRNFRKFRIFLVRNFRKFRIFLFRNFSYFIIPKLPKVSYFLFRNFHMLGSVQTTLNF